MDKNTEEKTFLSTLVDRIKTSFSENAQQESPPLTKNEFFAALGKSLHFKTMTPADRTIFKDLIVRHTPKTPNLSAKDCRNTIRSALEYLGRKYDGFTPTAEEGSIAIAKSLPKIIKGFSEENIANFANTFLSAKSTHQDYRKAQRMHEEYSNPKGSDYKIFGA